MPVTRAERRRERHLKILRDISDYRRRYKESPTQREVAERTGLTQKVVHNLIAKLRGMGFLVIPSAPGWRQLEVTAEGERFLAQEEAHGEGEDKSEDKSEDNAA